MNKVVARPVIQNKFWIVEKDGSQIATIQTTSDGVVYVHNNEIREKFVSIKLLKNKYNIAISKTKPSKPKNEISNNVYGFPCEDTPYNKLYDVSKRLPVYTKNEHSQSYFCAGHYLISYAGSYVHTFCPKLITLAKTDFVGPFKTKSAANKYIQLSKDKS